jgi:hypothetical protein
MSLCYFYTSISGFISIFTMNTEIGCINMTQLHSIFVNSKHLGDKICKELAVAICIYPIQKATND